MRAFLQAVLVVGGSTVLGAAFACSASGGDGDAESAKGEAALTSGTAITSGYAGKCLDDDGDGTGNGSKIQLWSCNGSTAQDWTFTSGTFVGPGGKCLDVTGDVQKAGTKVQLYACNGTAAQKWTVAGTEIKSSAGLCLDADGAVDANGTQVQLWQCNGGENQVWKVAATSPPPAVDAGKDAASKLDAAAPDAAEPDAGTSPPPGSTIVWKAGDPVLGKWEVANTYQCGTPVATGSTFSFELTLEGTSCGRNQANPLLEDGSAVRLTIGQTYTFSFRYVDGTPTDAPPGMGPDKDARSLVFQFHPYGSTTTASCIGNLNFANDPSTGAQVWQWQSCNGSGGTGVQHAVGSYTPGEVDDFVIETKVADGSVANSGYAKLWRNGQLVVSEEGGIFAGGCAGAASCAPFWNFGVYKFRWELANGGGSSMTKVNDTFENFTLTTP